MFPDKSFLTCIKNGYHVSKRFARLPAWHRYAGFRENKQDLLLKNKIHYRELEKLQNSQLIHKHSAISKVQKDETCVNLTMNDAKHLKESLADFVPKPGLYRNTLLERLQTQDMLRRRSILKIPEFYVGSILSVTSSDSAAPDRLNTFVGICIDRYGSMMEHCFVLRNVFEGQGVEISYYLYHPNIQAIRVLKLEKRLDDSLYYLRDAPPEYSSVPFSMQPEHFQPNAPVPINPIVVPLNDPPWVRKWHRLQNLKKVRGVSLPEGWDKKLWKFELTRFQNYKDSSGVEYDEKDIFRTHLKNVPDDEIQQIFSKIMSEITPPSTTS